MSKPRIIAIANQKGGIGKTTTATNIATILAERSKTLLIDADPQCNSTDTFRAVIKNTATLYDVILDYDEPLNINEAIQHTEIGDIVAADVLLKDAETTFRANAGEEYFRLKDALEQLKDYDYVIIDTAPSDNKLLKNCLIAADEVIVPITADRYGLQGLSELNKTIRTIQKRTNPSLKLAGLLLVKYHKNYKLQKEIEEGLNDIVEQIETKVFDTKIRESTATQKAQAARTTVYKYDKGSSTAKDYVAFVDEWLGE